MTAPNGERTKLSEVLGSLIDLSVIPSETAPDEWIRTLRSRYADSKSLKFGGKGWSRDSEFVLALGAFIVAQQGALSALTGGEGPPDSRTAHRAVDLWTILESAWLLTRNLAGVLDSVEKLDPPREALAAAALARAQEGTGRLIEELMSSPPPAGAPKLKPSALVDLLSDLEADLRVMGLGKAVREELSRLGERL